jgi:UDP-N-acetylmuramate dehydrogenase
LKLKPEECNFEYRSSKFKHEWKYKYVVTSAVFKMKKDSKTFELSYHEREGRYGSILEELSSFAKEPYTLDDVANAVKRQREKRLPSVDDYGTCGSFFRNPIISVKKFKELEKKISDLQSYPVENLNYRNEQEEKKEFVKIPAGRLLDELGWKGKWDGNVGIFDKHALCVVTNKKATGEEIFQFIQKMKMDVKENYDIDLIEEVDIVY